MTGAPVSLSSDAERGAESRGSMNAEVCAREGQDDATGRITGLSLTEQAVLGCEACAAPFFHETRCRPAGDYI